ncbi:MAG: TadE/TadG family type IV pilus assembly protein [Thermodesulfobacteriota bacterium]|nr:TadE/TadG family type IV pilus assembly protein [Thermodesulfobacteriota bacterium]
MVVRKLRNSKGASAVEFSLVALIFFIFIFGIIDFGWYFFVKHTIKLANHEGGVVGAVSSNDTSVRQVIRDYASIAVDPNDLSITVSTYSTNSTDTADIREVTTQYTHKFFFPMIAAFFPDGANGNTIIKVRHTYKLESPSLYSTE